MYKNVASQTVYLYAWDTGNNVPKTGDSANITAYVSIDGAAEVALGSAGGVTELDATNAPGVYYGTDGPTQAETNGDALLFSAKSSTSDIYITPVLVYTKPGTSAGITSTLGDVAHGGSSAVLTLERAVIASTTAGEPGIKVTGNTTGAGMLLTGGNAGNGLEATGSVAGIRANGTGVNAGIDARGGSSGHAIHAQAGASGGAGINAVSSADSGLKATGGTNSVGIDAVGNGTAAGLRCTGGATGQGIRAVGGATSGAGMTILATTDGDGLEIDAGANGHGIDIDGAGTGDGINATGGSTSGNGMTASGGTDSDGLALVGNGTGNDLSLEGDGKITGTDPVVTADAFAISGDATAADNAELFFDDTGFAASNSTIGTVTDVTNPVTTTDDLIVHSGTAQTATSSSITFNGAVSTTDYYNGSLVVITGGTGAGQARVIVDFGAGLAAIAPNWITTPDGTSTYAVFGFGGVRGTDGNPLISTDVQDLSASLNVDAKAISGSTAAADSVEANIDNLDAAVSSVTAPTAAAVADAVWGEVLSDHYESAGTMTKAATFMKNTLAMLGWWKKHTDESDVTVVTYDTDGSTTTRTQTRSTVGDRNTYTGS